MRSGVAERRVSGNEYGLEDPVVTKFSSEIRRKLGARLKSITLFGSRARGEASDTSDYDFLILLDKRDAETVRLIRQTEVELLDSYDALSGSLIYGEEEWALRVGLPLGINVRREGVEV
jgi:predicted nucleotidyltransferase